MERVVVSKQGVHRVALTPAEIAAREEIAPSVEDYSEVVSRHLDAVARERQYDDARSIASYVASTVPEWAAEAQAFVEWRDQVWTYAIDELERMPASEREAPTIAEFIAELPEIEWAGE